MIWMLLIDIVHPFERQFFEPRLGWFDLMWTQYPEDTHVPLYEF